MEQGVDRFGLTMLIVLVMRPVFHNVAVVDGVSIIVDIVRMHLSAVQVKTSFIVLQILLQLST